MLLLHRLQQAGIVALVSLFVLISWMDGSLAAAQGACNEADVPENYTLYAEDFKNGNYESALPYLKWIITCAPDFGTHSDRNFRRLVETYEGIGIAKEDLHVRAAYLDSALAVFDMAPTAMHDAGIAFDPFKWTFNKGYFIQSHAEDLPEAQQEVGALYLAAHRMDPTRLEGYYIDIITRDFVGNGQQTEALHFLTEVEAHRPDEADILDVINEWRYELIASPEDRISFLEHQRAKKPGDEEVWRELLQLYMDEGYRKEAFELVKTRINEVPSLHLYSLAGTMRLEDGFEEEAIAFFEQALESEPDGEQRGDIHYNLGVAHQQSGRFQRARVHFRQSMDAPDKFEETLIALGDLYVAAVHACDTFERTDRAVYWLATDYYERAASGSSSDLQKVALKRIKSIEAHFPSQDDKFFEQWVEGDAYKVDYRCYRWVNESTRVR